MTPAKIVALVGLLMLSACEEAPSPNSETPIGSGFDFYVMVLSWSPSYCEAEGDRADSYQCDHERPFGFVVHGLWPQFERGYPEYCAKNPNRVGRELEGEMLDIMPSRALVQHQWKKHGTCSKLSQSEFFETLRSAREKIVIPQELKNTGGYRTVAPGDVSAKFIKANPDMESAGVAITCDRRRLREIRICMTKDLDFRTCPEVAKRGCRRQSVSMPPQRSR